MRLHAFILGNFPGHQGHGHGRGHDHGHAHANHDVMVKHGYHEHGDNADGANGGDGRHYYYYHGYRYHHYNYYHRHHHRHYDYYNLLLRARINGIELNSIELPAVMWQGHYYGADRPAYINYGAIGSAIAHEMSHGLTGFGMFFDEHGENEINASCVYCHGRARARA